MATIYHNDITDPGALITYTFLSLSHNFGIFFYKTGQTMGHSVRGADPTASVHIPKEKLSQIRSQQSC